MQLREYQQEDVEFLAKLNAAGIFNEQRTGKTPTVLMTLKQRHLEDKKVIIITTASSIYSWKNEFETWLNKPCVACVGTLKQRQKKLEEWTNGLIISMDSVKTTQRSTGMIQDILKLKPAAVILDEAHRIKTPNTAVAKAMFKLSKIPVRYALTGTPAPGKPEEVFSILKFLYPKVFSSYWKFLEHFFAQANKTIYVAGRPRNIIEWNGFAPGKQQELQKILSQMATQRKRKDVMPWLPDKDYTQIKLPPTSFQEKYLKELKETFETEDLKVVGTLDRLIRYRQICLDPTLVGLKGKSPKTEWIKDYLKDYPEEHILIFSKFTSYLIKLFNELTVPRALLIGSTPIKTRQEYIQDFQDGKFNVFLINIDAGKEAITLDTATTIIFTDKYPPIGDMLQAEDRFIATTPEKANKPHKIYEVMISGTFDEDIYKLLQKRLTEVDVINNFKKYMKGE